MSPAWENPPSRDTEINVLASLILLYHTHKMKGYSDDTIYPLLFSAGTDLYTSNKLGYSIHSYNKTIKGLKEKGILVGGIINPNYIPDNEFEITYRFEKAGNDVLS